MKKLLIVIAVGLVAGVVYYCTYDEGYHINDWTWHEKEKQVIGWEQTNTIDVGNALFRVEYPDFFVLDSVDNIHSRLLLADTIGKGMEMIAFSLKNSGKWDTETAAELIAIAKLEEWSTPADWLFYKLNYTTLAYLTKPRFAWYEKK